MADTEDKALPEYPEGRSTSDYLVPLARGGVGAVPFVGGLLGEVIGFAWTPSLQKRQADWFKKLGERIQELAARVADIEDRLRREDVLTIAANAARAAAATHEEGKRAALRAAVINTALEVEPDGQMRLVFVTLIDRLSAAHLQLLSLFAEPAEFFASRNRPPPSFELTSSIARLVKAAFPDWDDDLIHRVAVDLDQNGLAQVSRLNTTMTAGGAMERRITPLGTRFLRFISDEV